MTKLIYIDTWQVSNYSARYFDRVGQYISIGDIDDTDQGLPLGASELLVVALGDHTPPRVILVGGQIRDLDTTSVIFVLQNKNENLKNRKKCMLSLTIN